MLSQSSRCDSVELKLGLRVGLPAFSNCMFCSRCRSSTLTFTVSWSVHENCSTLGQHKISRNTSLFVEFIRSANPGRPMEDSAPPKKGRLIPYLSCSIRFPTSTRGASFAPHPPARLLCSTQLWVFPSASQEVDPGTVHSPRSAALKRS